MEPACCLFVAPALHKVDFIFFYVLSYIAGHQKLNHSFILVYLVVATLQ